MEGYEALILILVNLVGLITAFFTFWDGPTRQTEWQIPGHFLLWVICWPLTLPIAFIQWWKSDADDD